MGKPPCLQTKNGGFPTKIMSLQREHIRCHQTPSNVQVRAGINGRTAGAAGRVRPASFPQGFLRFCNIWQRGRNGLARKLFKQGTHIYFAVQAEGLL
jgi:hypothetical protein